MIKRVFDIIMSVSALVVLSPILVCAAIAIKISSPGPCIYKAIRVGKNGKLFTMYKFRTMHVDHGGFASAITGTDDPRVFKVGKILRFSKIDELPQLFNILMGKMSIVGPRPEDKTFVDNHYSEAQKETLEMLPGLTSPGSVYYYTHAHHFIGNEDPEKDYIEKIMGVKLALDIVYIRKSSFLYDLALIYRTLSTIIKILISKKNFSIPHEMKEAINMGLVTKDKHGNFKA